MTALWDQWRNAFVVEVQRPTMATLLKEASLTKDLGSWTNSLTTVAVRCCESLGWVAAAKWNPCERLRQKGKEYLSIDVMAFPAQGADKDRDTAWPLPIAAIELENDPKDVRVAYSLWKVLCIRARLRVVIAYRNDWDQSRKLVGRLSDEVVRGGSLHGEMAMSGSTLVMVGNRGEGDTFPWGYFKFWLLDNNLGRFEKV